MALAPHTRLGSFEILSVLGAGGMGEVYRARDARLGRTVAVKILRPDKVHSLHRFRHEARVISRLNHPHICSIHDVGEENGMPFLVMEYLEGQTLADRLDEGAIPLSEALRYAIEICDGLAEAHRQGVVHRDVKPGNVMLTRGGVKLLDFGLAKLRQPEAEGESEDTIETLHLTADDGMVGTVSYMPPEQLEGRRVDHRSDLFAVGAVLYEMVTGRRAFEGTSRASVTAAILTSDPTPMSSCQPVTPPRLEGVVRRCLARSPDDRWQNARDLGWELKSIAEEGAHASNVVRERRRHAMLVGAVIGAGLVAAISAAWIFWPVETLQPAYDRLTFRRGVISSARFAPDGHTVVFSAAWDARPYELFLARIGSTESRSLGIANGRILSVSPTGEMAVLLGTQQYFGGGVGTLARVPLAGGVPREIAESVTEADWGPDGQLAIVRRRNGTMELEFPIGTKVHDARSIWSMRVSPTGDRIAFFESAAPGSPGWGEVVVLDRSRKKTTVARALTGLGLAWSPAGDEVWFTGARLDGPPMIRAVSLTGRERIVERVPAPLMLGDISRDGRALVTKGLNLGGITCLIPGETQERGLGWLDNARVEGLSADATTLLFGAMEGNWKAGVYARSTHGSPAVRLGDGHPESLSPDGKWVLARASGAPTAWGREWVLVPTGPGQVRLLPGGAITQLGEGAWLPHGNRIVFTAIEEGRAVRAYVQDVESGSMRPITPEGVYMPEKASTPDGTSVLVSLDGRWLLYPVDGGEPRVLTVLGAGDHPLKWSADGHFLYIAPRRTAFVPPLSIQRLDIRTGRREAWKTLTPSDPAGVEVLDPPVITADGRGYCYSYARRQQELYVVEGLK